MSRLSEEEFPGVVGGDADGACGGGVGLGGLGVGLFQQFDWQQLSQYATVSPQ